MRLASLRRPLWPLVPLYALATAARNWLFDRGWLSQRSLQHRVISVGSLSAGGAGKTPVVLMLAEMLHRQGFEVRILTRGYGRSGKATERVDAIGDPDRFGDEPLLLARRAPWASVWVGADRYASGVLSQKNDTPATRAVYLLDDGFQHRKLARDVDLLLLTQQDLQDSLLPAGNLREPLTSTKRAHFVIIRDDEADAAQAFAAQIHGELPPILTIKRQLRFPEGLSVPSRPLVFCGLARPDSLLAMLSAHAVAPIASSIFPDHHAYSSADIEDLIRSAAAHQADGFIATEKDAVKLTPAMIKRLETIGPLCVPRLDVEPRDGWPSPDPLNFA